MLHPRYLLIRRDARPSRGIGLHVESTHWFKRTAQRKARSLEARQASQVPAPLANSYTWEVETRCG